MRLTRAVIALVAACAAAALPTTPAAAATPAARVISGPSPVPQTGSLCSPLAGPIGRHNYEYQPSLAVSPGGGHRIAAAWAQDFDDAVVVGVSDDGGATWRRSVPGWDGRDPSSAAGFMACENGSAGLNSAHNPHVAVGKDGIVYAMADLLADPRPGAAVLLSSSADGGLTWRTPTVFATSRTAVENATTGAPTTTVGWTAIAVDPHRSGVAYAAWDVAQGDATTGLTGGTEYVAGTTDGGLSWSKPVAIGTPDGDRMWTGCTLLVRPDGSLLTVFNDSPVGGASGADTSIRVVSSSDGGTTWSPPVDVMPRQQVNRVPDAALSPDGSEVYVAWFDGWTDGMPFLSRSVNGGAFTTAPVVGAAPGTVQSLNVAVASDGTVGLLYNDMRHNPDSDHLITDVWLAQSPDQGATFAESHVAGPFDVAATSPVAGVGVGEWQGLRGAPRGFALAYTVVNPTGVSDPPVQAVQPSSVFSSNPTDIVFSRFTS